MILLAIDPGLNSTGFAYFYGTELKRCGQTSCKDSIYNFLTEFDGADRVVVEVPQIYERRKSKGDPNDLIPLCLIAGAFAGKFFLTDLIKPRQWKGTIPKTKNVADYILHKRNLKILPAKSLKNYMEGLAGCPLSLRHNIADAVGLGIWYLTKHVQTFGSKT